MTKKMLLVSEPHCCSGFYLGIRLHPLPKFANLQRRYVHEDWRQSIPRLSFLSLSSGAGRFSHSFYPSLRLKVLACHDSRSLLRWQSAP